jgi:hypothetical protein
LQVGARFAARGHKWRAQLDQRLGLLADLEADLQRFRLERCRHRQHDVGLLGARVEEQVGVDEEVEGRESVAPTRAVSVGHHQIGAEIQQRAWRVPGLESRRSCGVDRRTVPRTT